MSDIKSAYHQIAVMPNHQSHDVCLGRWTLRVHMGSIWSEGQREHFCESCPASHTSPAAQCKIKFVGYIIGSGERSPDPDKVSTVKDMKILETKRQVRRLIGFFSYFRDYSPNFAEIAKALTDLTGKRVSNKIPWGTKENQAFQTLKGKLCEATTQPMSIADFDKP